MRETEDEWIYRKVKRYIEENHMIVSGDTVAAGISGGADSVCLLDMLYRLSGERDFRLLVVHVHHGVRDQADQDAAYVEKLCRERGIPYYLKRVNMDAYAKVGGLSPEEAGRELRYLAFEEVLKKAGGDAKTGDALMGVCAGKIAVAHNSNDRAETMLFHLFRGSGTKGLTGIHPTRGRIIRPLLCLERTQIEDYLKARKLSYCIDSTNEEDTYTRNKIRHHILSYAVKEINENTVAHMAHTASVLDETEKYIERQISFAGERCIEKSKTSIPERSEDGTGKQVMLKLDELKKEDPYIIKRLLLHCMEEVTEHGKNVTSKHLGALMALLNKSGSGELFLTDSVKAYKEYDRLFLYRETKPYENKGRKNRTADIGNDTENTVYEDISVEIPGSVCVPEVGILDFSLMPRDAFIYKNIQIIPEKRYTKWFDYDKITTVLLLRTRRTGDYLTIDEAFRKKTIKEYMIQKKIPKMQRERMYILADGAHILWVPGYRISQYYKVGENTKCILQVQLRGGELCLNE